MYSDWASLSSEVQNLTDDRLSVLETFSKQAGKDVVVAIVKQLASNPGVKPTAEPSSLLSAKDVDWTMEVGGRSETTVAIIPVDVFMS